MYTFVAVDQLGAPIAVPAIMPEDGEEEQRFAGALRLRQLRLVLAGKMKPADATELKALFVLFKLRSRAVACRPIFH